MRFRLEIEPRLWRDHRTTCKAKDDESALVSLIVDAMAASGNLKLSRDLVLAAGKVKCRAFPVVEIDDGLWGPFTADGAFGAGESALQMLLAVALAESPNVRDSTELMLAVGKVKVGIA